MFSWLATVFSTAVKIVKDIVIGLFFDTFLHVASNN